MARTHLRLLLPLCLAALACVRVRTEVGTDRADADVPAAAVVRPAAAADVDPWLDALRSIGFGWYADTPAREHATVGFEDGLFASRRVYAQVRPRQTTDGGLELTVVLDGGANQRGPIAAAALAHELEHVWQFRHAPQLLVDDCPEAEATAYEVEARALKALTERYGTPSDGLRDYERAIVAAHDAGDWQHLRELARQYSCAGPRYREITHTGPLHPSVDDAPPS